MGHREGHKDVHWTELAQDRINLWILVPAVLHLLI